MENRNKEDLLKQLEEINQKFDNTENNVRLCYERDKILREICKDKTLEEKIKILGHIPDITSYD